MLEMVDVWLYVDKWYLPGTPNPLSNGFFQLDVSKSLHGKWVKLTISLHEKKLLV